MTPTIPHFNRVNGVPRPTRRQPAGVPPLPDEANYTDGMATGEFDDVPDYHTEYQAAKADVWAEVVFVSPAWAEQVLERCNRRNRKQKQNTITRLENAITGRLWRVNGEPLIFSSAGSLIDGQHRLQAVVNTGVPVPMLAVFGVNELAFDSLDQTAGRTAKDVLTIPTDDRTGGEADAAALASALGWLYRFEQGCPDRMNVRPQNTEVLDLLRRHPDMRDCLAYARAKCQHGKHPAGLFAALVYLFGRVDRDLCHLFMTELLEEVGIQPGTHMALLTRWFRNRHAGANKRVGQDDYVTIAALTIKTWNRVRMNAPVPQALMWRADEGFPQIDGLTETE